MVFVKPEKGFAGDGELLMSAKCCLFWKVQLSSCFTKVCLYFHLACVLPFLERFCIWSFHPTAISLPQAFILSLARISPHQLWSCKTQMVICFGSGTHQLALTEMARQTTVSVFKHLETETNYDINLNSNCSTVCCHNQMNFKIAMWASLFLIWYARHRMLIGSNCRIIS